MAKFKYRSKGSANEDWYEDSIEAEDERTALVELDKIYGIERDERGNQLNLGTVTIELINE